jgi:hypothetical protein
VTTSGLYNTLTPANQLIIDDAFSRIGMVPGPDNENKIRQAIRSANLLLTSWPNRGLNLFTTRNQMLNLNPGQAIYQLPDNIIQVLTVMRRTSVRNLSGTAAASSGVAINAFDGDPATACTQNAANGNISYQWSTPFPITLVGVTSFVDANYTLSFEFSLDGATWVAVSTAPLQFYSAGQNVWFKIPIPFPGTYFRVRETGGATLNISELYFNNQIVDSTMSPWSLAEYTQQANKDDQGQPSQFFFDRHISPSLYLWQTPSAQYNCLYFTYTTAIEDLGSMVNTPAIASRFLEALIFGMSHRLAFKYPKEVPVGCADAMEKQYEKELGFVLKADKERVPLRIYADFQTGYPS